MEINVIDAEVLCVARAFVLPCLAEPFCHQAFLCPTRNCTLAEALKWEQKHLCFFPLSHRRDRRVPWKMTLFVTPESAPDFGHFLSSLSAHEQLKDTRQDQTRSGTWREALHSNAAGEKLLPV